jgi:prepilin-type N-terminal cleavage/methylation domain-containing protein
MLNSSRGFTLIETSIVLALTLGFAVLAIGFFSGLRSQAQFSDSIDSLKNDILARRQEALATIKVSGGTDASAISVGRLLTFTPGSTTVQVSALETKNTDGAVPDPAQLVTAVRPSSDTFDINIPWNASYQSTCAKAVYVIFMRKPSDGALITSVLTSTLPSLLTDYSYGNLISGAASVNPVPIPLYGSGQGGSIYINPNSSSVTVKYNGGTTLGSLLCP